MILKTTIPIGPASAVTATFGRNRSHADLPTGSISQKEAYLNAGCGSPDDENGPVGFPEGVTKGFVYPEELGAHGQHEDSDHVGNDRCVEWIDSLGWTSAPDDKRSMPPTARARGK